MTGFELEAHDLYHFLQDLSHHYSQMSPESRLEVQIYSTVLLCCLQRSSDLEIQINGFSIAQVSLKINSIIIMFQHCVVIRKIIF